MSRSSGFIDGFQHGSEALKTFALQMDAVIS
jgi:hypothetical protein